ncbi:hypothetical protein G9A89_000924 [Geosiphon pyriformis]|nr:hypothetical protein G9A89_000924 [Geosiphon pyriformis]
MKKLNIGAYVTIPLQIRFLQLGLNLERVESRHSKETIASLIIPRHELRYLQPVLVNHNDRECVCDQNEKYA